MTDKDRVLIFDTTLRDGEQSPGCSMNLEEKLRVGQALAALGVDVIEAGFPAASPGDFDAVQALAENVSGPVICGLARCNAGDIEATARALDRAAAKRIHVFVATSAIHREHKLQMAKEEIIRSAVEGVRLARTFCDDVEFSPEDASRTEPEYLAEVVAAAIGAGATTVNIPDTVGYTVPGEFSELFRYLKSSVAGIDDITLSVHCHDDLGMAVANSLAAVEAGARQVECTINGIGERAGNCSLEELVMALRTRAAYFGLTTGVKTERLYPTCRLVSTITGMPIPRNKAIVGGNAFSHESGIHQHGMLRNTATYEIMSPKDVGLNRSNLVLGKHSGRHAFRERINDLGFALDDVELNRAFAEFKKLADQKKEVFDSDIESLVLHAEIDRPGPWRLTDLRIASGKGAFASAALGLTHVDGREVREASVGDGPIDAAFKAIERATGVEAPLMEFDVRSVSIGEDAQGEVAVHVQCDGRDYRGLGVSTDITEAGALAFLDVINRILRARERSAGLADRKASLAAGSI
jgi:2-isopropylmalate synthase